MPFVIGRIVTEAADSGFILEFAASILLLFLETVSHPKEYH